MGGEYLQIQKLLACWARKVHAGNPPIHIVSLQPQVHVPERTEASFRTGFDAALAGFTGVPRPLALLTATGMKEGFLGIFIIKPGFAAPLTLQRAPTFQAQRVSLSLIDIEGPGPAAREPRYESLHNIDHLRCVGHEGQHAL